MNQKLKNTVIDVVTSNNTNVVTPNNTNVVAPTITQNVRINDKDEFDNLMTEYFDEQSDLNQLNRVIDNDKTIKNDIFKRQLITDFLEFKNAVEEHSQKLNDDENTIYSFYEFLKQFLIYKNNLVSTVGHYNIEENYGTNNVISQFEALENLERKNHEVNKTYKPDSIIEIKRKEEQLQEYDKQSKIKKILEWIGTNNTFCSENFEHNDVIKEELNISSFTSLQNTLLSYDDKKFNDIYNFFYNIYSGDEYREFILKDNTNIVNFVNSQKEVSQSFRSFILKLCSDTFIELNKDGKYASVYLNTMNGYKDKNKNLVKGHLEKKHSIIKLSINGLKKYLDLKNLIHILILLFLPMINFYVYINMYFHRLRQIKLYLNYLNQQIKK